LLLCGGAFFLALALTGFSLRALSPLMEAQLGRPAPAGPSTIELDPTSIVVLAGVSLLVAFTFAWIPLLAPLRDPVAGALSGIYGVTAFVALQRRHEIGIRVALGAPRETIIRMFLREGARVVAVGMGLGLLAATGAVRILGSQVYGIQPFDTPTVILSGVVMGAAGLLTIWWPARRAVQGDPIAALRTE